VLHACPHGAWAHVAFCWHGVWAARPGPMAEAAVLSAKSWRKSRQLPAAVGDG
jgi:hypothetical protein